MSRWHIDPGASWYGKATTAGQMRRLRRACLIFMARLRFRKAKR